MADEIIPGYVNPVTGKDYIILGSAHQEETVSRGDGHAEIPFP